MKQLNRKSTEQAQTFGITSIQQNSNLKETLILDMDVLFQSHEFIWTDTLIRESEHKRKNKMEYFPRKFINAVRSLTSNDDCRIFVCFTVTYNNIAVTSVISLMNSFLLIILILPLRIYLPEHFNDRRRKRKKIIRTLDGKRYFPWGNHWIENGAFLLLLSRERFYLLATLFASIGIYLFQSKIGIINIKN